MVKIPIWFIFGISTLFVLSPAVIGAIELFRVGLNTYNVVALLIYLISGLTALYFYRELKMPLVLAVGVFVSSVAITFLVNIELDATDFGTPATWYVTAASTLLAICAVRQQRVIAWIGIEVLTLQVLAVGGLNSLFVSGLGGAIALVAAAHALSVGLERSAKQTAGYLEAAKETEAARAAASAIRSERSERLSMTLRGALPMLEKIATTELTDADRNEAAMLEAELRDQIRGRTLVNAQLKDSIRSARLRGVEVVVLDEGGLEKTPETERDQLLNKVSQQLDQISQGRVTIRSPKIEDVRITFVASRPGTAKPDVFLKL